jgi:hypothetical protein
LTARTLAWARFVRRSSSSASASAGPSGSNDRASIEEICWLAMQAFDALGCEGLARVDFVSF